MNNCLLICVGYVFLCLLFSALIPCAKVVWIDFYKTVIIGSLNDLKDKSISYKIKDFFGMILILPILCFLILLILPFCFYWLNRHYKFEKKYQEEDKGFQNFVPEPPVKEEYLHSAIIIKLKESLPFTPVEEQVIYLESRFNENLNNYISKEYEKISKAFKQKYFNFIYIPQLIKKIEDYKEDIVFYSLPNLDNRDIHLNEDISSQHIGNNILSYSDEPVNLTGGLLHYKETKDSCHIFTYYQFEKFEESEIWEQFRAYLSIVGNGSAVLYSLSPPEKTEDKADSDFSYAAQHLIDEIKERIEQLQQIGISEMILKSLLKIDVTIVLSKMIITNDYRILLPDYNNLEIIMSPLPKAVFFLFLKHPEGILFKHLQDYKNELMNIYMQVSNREKLRDMKKSIDDVIDPTKNAINEKCSRIREAFIKHFDESVAKNYFITGLRSEPKKIILSRELITWETEV